LKTTLIAIACVFLASSAFAQDRGAVTGTVADGSGALIPSVKITLTNSETGAKTETVTTGTGNYMAPALPSGVYTMSVEHPGFSSYQQTNIRVQVAVTSRVDVTLQVGQSTTSVQVTAESSMLKTESGEQSSTISGDTINSLPINFGIGAGAIRNPLSFVQLTPGATISGWNTIKVNGNPTGTFRILFEGQESSSGLDARVSDESQPSVEAIQEFTLQTSNFAAEFGLAAGGLFNFTSRGGTNQFHGSAYDYIVNEAFAAGVPFTTNGAGQHQRAQSRLHDMGFSFGGPVWIPKVYNGKNKTFFMYGFEGIRESRPRNNGVFQIPTNKMRTGDFSELLAIGPQFQLYNPFTRRADTGGRFRQDPFVGNIIPTSMINPVAKKFIDT